MLGSWYWTVLNIPDNLEKIKTLMASCLELLIQSKICKISFHWMFEIQA
jgi:hypothetical protein